jgi:hypothetical protein
LAHRRAQDRQKQPNPDQGNGTQNVQQLFHWGIGKYIMSNNQYICVTYMYLHSLLDYNPSALEGTNPEERDEKH